MAAQDQTSPNRPRVAESTKEVVSSSNHHSKDTTPPKEVVVVDTKSLSSSSATTPPPNTTPQCQSNIHTTKSNTNANSTTYKARNQIFQIGVEMGILAQTMHQYAPSHDPILQQQQQQQQSLTLLEKESFWTTESNERTKIHKCIQSFFGTLVEFCTICNICLMEAILKKMELNKLKYRPEHCKVRLNT